MVMNVHVNIITNPVLILVEYRPSDGRAQHIFCLTLRKPRDKVHRTNNVHGIHKTKCCITFHKANLMQFFGLPSPYFLAIQAEPVNKEKFHLLWLSRLGFQTGLYNHCIENTHDASVPVRMWIILRQHHNIAMSVWIQGILGASSVVCCVIYP